MYNTHLDMMNIKKGKKNLNSEDFFNGKSVTLHDKFITNLIFFFGRTVQLNIGLGHPVSNFLKAQLAWVGPARSQHLTTLHVLKESVLSFTQGAVASVALEHRN